MRIKTTIVALAVTALALGAAACGGDDDNSDSATTPVVQTTDTGGSGAESVSFVDPADGSMTGDTVTAHVKLAGFQIDAADVGGVKKAGEGHLHFSMDDGQFDTPKYSGANGKLAVQLGVDGMYSPSTEPQITYKNLPPGEHTLVVHLANNDHSDTGVSATTTFTVQ